jgi:uncharacterized protein (TIGR03435 family)
MHKCIFFLVCSCLAQTAQPERVVFEAASVKRSPRHGGIQGGIRGGPGTETPGYIYATNFSLSTLIQRAYELKPYQYVYPSWMDEERYDIVAKIPQGTSRHQSNLMMQALLLERFELKAHPEKRDLPVYLLTLAKGGPKIIPVTEGADDAFPSLPNASGRSTTKKEGDDGFPDPDPEMLRGGIVRMFLGNKAKIIVNKQPLDRFAEVLSRTLQRAVVDRTGLQGLYSFVLRWTLDQGPSQSLDAVPGAPIFTAIQQDLGLKLQSSKSKLEVFIVDSANKTPAEN